MPEPTLPPDDPFVGAGRWNPEHPRVMVVCCSDGRLQEATDEFLHRHLGVRHYDRLYAPGGPAALAPGDAQKMQKYREDAAFLIQAHGVQELILIFHGPAPDGPAAAACAQYRRTYPAATPDEIRAQQGEDAEGVAAFVRSLDLPVRVHAYRAEVLPAGPVQFVPLALPTS